MILYNSELYKSKSQTVHRTTIAWASAFIPWSGKSYYLKQEVWVVFSSLRIVSENWQEVVLLINCQEMRPRVVRFTETYFANLQLAFYDKPFDILVFTTAYQIVKHCSACMTFCKHAMV